MIFYVFSKVLKVKKCKTEGGELAWELEEMKMEERGVKNSTYVAFHVAATLQLLCVYSYAKFNLA